MALAHAPELAKITTRTDFVERNNPVDTVAFRQWRFADLTGDDLTTDDGWPTVFERLDRLNARNAEQAFYSLAVREPTGETDHGGRHGQHHEQLDHCGKMMHRMRIGELLVEQRKLRQSDLTRALAEATPGKRLCSILIKRGLVDYDDAARALGEQKGVPCALAKHIAGRDPKLASLIPAELGRSSFALPIGKSSRGEIVVCVRDPAPALLATLERAIGKKVTMVITPAARLDDLLLESYGDSPVEEFDVDFSSQVEAPNLVTPSRTMTPPRPPLPDLSALDPDSVRLSLTDLDDVRVDKDPTQSGQIPIVSGARPSTIPPLGRAIRPASEPSRAMTLDAMRAGLDQATSREAATDVVLSYVSTRWLAAVVFAVRENMAMGYRGYRVIAPESITISLTSPSTVQAAVESRSVSAQRPNGVAQDTLIRALSGPTNPAAAPVLVGGKAVAVLAVGDPVEGDLTNVARDLETLTEALGSAYSRILAR